MAVVNDYTFWHETSSCDHHQRSKTEACAADVVLTAKPSLVLNSISRRAASKGRLTSYFAICLPNSSHPHILAFEHAPESSGDAADHIQRLKPRRPRVEVILHYLYMSPYQPCWKAPGCMGEFSGCQGTAAANSHHDADAVWSEQRRHSSCVGSFVAYLRNAGHRVQVVLYITWPRAA